MQLYSDSKKCENLDRLRSFTFKKALNKRGLVQKKVDTRRLPPSSSAASYHSLRVYHQLQEWLGNQMEPSEYGWEVKDGKFIPRTTNLPIAPEEILKRIRCQCKSDCKSGNGSCKRIALFCSNECGCNNDDCCNMQPIANDGEDEFYDEDNIDL